MSVSRVITIPLDDLDAEIARLREEATKMPLFSQVRQLASVQIKTLVSLRNHYAKEAGYAD